MAKAVASMTDSGHGATTWAVTIESGRHDVVMLETDLHGPRIAAIVTSPPTSMSHRQGDTKGCWFWGTRRDSALCDEAATARSATGSTGPSSAGSLGTWIKLRAPQHGRI